VTLLGRQERRWIPAFAGMTSGSFGPSRRRQHAAWWVTPPAKAAEQAPLYKAWVLDRVSITAPSSREGGDPSESVVSSRKTLDSRLRGNDERGRIPAFAGMTSGGGFPPSRVWRTGVGLESSGASSALQSMGARSGYQSPRRHPREGGDPVTLPGRHERRWIPAFAGMTSGSRSEKQRSKLRSTKHGFSIRLQITAPSSPRRRGSSDFAWSLRKTLDSRLRGNDVRGRILAFAGMTSGKARQAQTKTPPVGGVSS